jgi:hypothetical protein
VSEFMNIFGDINLFGSVSVIAYLLLPADNQSVRHHLLVDRILQFDEETTTHEFFTMHPPILYTIYTICPIYAVYIVYIVYMGLCETIFVNIVLNITLISIDLMFTIPESVL